MKLEKIKARGAEGLYREATSKIIYFRQYKKGKGEVKLSTKTTALADAKSFRDQYLKRASQILTSSKQRKFALELFDLWVNVGVNLGAAKATTESKKASRKHFAYYFEGMMPEEITADWWNSVFVPETRFLSYKQGGVVKVKKARTLANDRKWLTSFMKHLVSSKIVINAPVFLNPDCPRDPGKVFTNEEVENLLNMAQNEDLFLAIAMAVTMGMRRGEIFRLKTDRVDLKQNVIHLRAEDTKIRKPRSFAISDKVLPFITFRAKTGSDWIFPSKGDLTKPLTVDGYTTAWRNLKKMTGITGKFHYLRHTFLTRAFKSPGANPALICAYAGLSLEVAEKVYLHLNFDDTRTVAGLVDYEI